MIWVLGIGLALAVSLYLIAPFIARNVSSAPSAELESYRDELRAIEQSAREQNQHPEAAKKAILQARLLKAARAEAPLAGVRSAVPPVLITAGLLGGSLGLYGVLGTPNFNPEVPQEAPTQAAEGTSDFRTLLPKFEARLAENPNDATGWTLYGRTLMLVGDTDAGLRAYERALDLSDTADIRKEYEAAKTFAAQTQSGPSAEDIAAMENLSEADRTAAIQGMVESLRARLENAPNDPQGWTRLLRSRKVLGQIEAGQADIKTLRKVLPEQADEIIARSGWEEPSE